MSFESLGLCAELLRAVQKSGYTVPTPIQVQAIPLVLAGHDLMAGAQTGTGKTAGFTLPLLQRIKNQAPSSKKKHIQALVLVPTRELAAQVQESIHTYSEFLNVTSLSVFGGVSIRPQISRLQRGVDILVATPGRLLDHVSQNTVDLSQVNTLILDEADRMLDMGFMPDVRRILKLLPVERQTLLFSATFSREITDLANTFLRQPKSIQVSQQNNTADTVSQVVKLVDQKRKRELLSHMIGAENWGQVLVFTRTKHGANRLATQLEKDGIRSAAIHGNKSQGARTRALAEFKQGKVQALVATDIAARGLDIDQLPHVVNFELPHKPEDYVHRIGRTGRAGNVGQAISLVSGDEAKLLQDIEKMLKRQIPRKVLVGYEPDAATMAQFERPGAQRPNKSDRPSGNRNPRGRNPRSHRGGHRAA